MAQPGQRVPIVRMRLRAALHSAVRRLAHRLGYITLWRNYYVPVPDFATLPAEVWVRRSDLGGITWDLDEQLSWLRNVWMPASAGWSAATAARPVLAENAGYAGADAALLYAVVHANRPARIVELGAGYSTLVIAMAVRELRKNGLPIRYASFDPFPSNVTSEAADVVQVEAISAQTVDAREFTALRAGDILFVDTTHTVQLGGDVNRIVLEVIPTLAEGVLVHFHDIFLPYEYPRELVEGLNYLWAEQYVLQAFLEFNDSFVVLCGLAALQRDRASEMAGLGLMPPPRASSLWIRRTAPRESADDSAEPQ